MKETLRKEIKCLTQQIAVSGYEWNIAAFLAERAASYVDEEKLLSNGTLVLKLAGKQKGPKVVLSAHMDEVGYVIKGIGENGYLYFGKIGGSSENILPARKVLIQAEKEIIPGVIGARSTHMLSDEELKKMQSVQESFIDVGAVSREQVEGWGIRVGSQVVIESECTELKDKDYLVTRAADCRALCAVLIDCIRRISKEDIPGELYIVFSSMEEVTTQGINAAVHIIEPDYTFVLDTVPAGDVPGMDAKDNAVVLNGGAVLILAQHNPKKGNYAVAHPCLQKVVREIALQKKIKTQEIAFVGAYYSTDACGMINAGAGNAVMTIALPRRYSHSPTEIINLNDCVEIEKLLLELIKRNIDVSML